MKLTAFRQYAVVVLALLALCQIANALTVRRSLQRTTRSQYTRLSASIENESPPKTDPETARKKSTAGKSWIKCRPIGVGACAGQADLPNGAFETLVDTSDKWIVKRTGISNRRIIQSGGLRDIATESAKQALADAGVDGGDIDLVIVATSSPDDMFGDAASVAKAVGAHKAAAFDLTAACSGFVFGMVTAGQFMHTGAYKKILLVGADALTRFLNWEDRGSCILFGDGSGAVVMEATDSIEDSGLLGFALHSDGDGYCNLQLKWDSQFTELTNEQKTVVDKGQYVPMTMNGAEVYKFAVSRVPEVIDEALNNAGLLPSDVDWLLLHQANIRIMEHAADVLGIPMDRVLKNIHEYGNTSAGSIPLALAEAVKAGKVKKGDIIACAGFGAGLSWSSAIIKWGG